ncbi:MAG TPA: META domain-containing protein [Marmoricola sp.]|nr:META domain-containing protein [Marmoricola sp.]
MQDEARAAKTSAGALLRRGPLAGLLLPALVCLALAALAGCGNGTDVPPHAPVTLTDTPTGSSTSTPTGSPTGSSTGTTTGGTTPAATFGTADLEGKAYASTTVTGHRLAHGTHIELRFDQGRMAVFAGCNTMVAPYEVTGGVLRWTSPPATGMATCNAPLTAQDQWVKATFGNDLRVAGDTSGFTLSNNAVSMQFAPKQAPRLSSVLNRKWTLVGTFANGRSQAVPRGHRPPDVSVAADGTARLFTGCNAGRTKVAVKGQTLSFSGTTATSARCPTALKDVENTMLGVLRATADSATVEETQLVVLRGERGLVFVLA